MNQSRVKVLTLAAMCSALFMTNTDDTVLNVALPQIQTSLGSDVSGLQWILNAYTLPAASLALTSGTFGDTYGRKRLFLAGVAIFMVASVISGCATNMGILISGRVLQGIGAAALIPTSLSILTHTFPKPQEQTQAIAIWSAVSALALIAGPVIGGLLVDVFGWQSTFFMNIPFGAIAFWITTRFVKEAQHKRSQYIDLPGLILSIVFLAALTYALIEGNTQTWRSPLIIGLFAIAGMSFIALLVVESHSSHPLLPLNLFKNPSFSVVNAVHVLVMFTFISLLFIFSLFLQQVQGYSAVGAGVRFLPLNGAFVVALLISGWLAARVGWRLTMAVGLTLAGLATLSFTGLRADTEYGSMMWMLIVSGFGGGLTLPPLAAVAMSVAPLSQAGIASAVLNTTNRLGGILGIALQGTILMQRQATDLVRSLSAWNLPSNLQNQIVADVLRNGAKLPANLPANINPSQLQQAIHNAFVSGLHATVLVASIALLAGAVLVLVFVPSTVKQHRVKI
jgi:EmrB/QacA subfamily drug resistance transporter